MASVPFLSLLFLTDLFDGFFARRWQVCSNFGYVLDGVADRATHIALVVALIATHRLSGVLGFALIFRDLVLYAARALFDTWWGANGVFRRRVRIAAILFKITVGGLALFSYADSLSPQLESPLFTRAVTLFTAATWIFAAWSYLLLGQQIYRYAVSDTHGAGDARD